MPGPFRLLPPDSTRPQAGPGAAPTVQGLDRPAGLAHSSSLLRPVHPACTIERQTTVISSRFISGLLHAAQIRLMYCTSVV